MRRFGRTVLDRQTPVYSNQRLCAVIRKQDVLILTERLHIHVGVDAVAVENMPVEVDCDIRTFRNGNRIVELIRSFPAHRLAVPNFEIAAEVAMQYDLLFYAVVAVRFFVGVLYRLLDGVERSKRIEFENCVVVELAFRISPASSQKFSTVLFLMVIEPLLKSPIRNARSEPLRIVLFSMTTVPELYAIEL